jgi:hypothetical protein
MGIYPTSFTDIMAPAVDRLIGSFHTAMAHEAASHALASIAQTVTP